ncbi:hypothetical protein [Sinorhizobium fredii]|uniref:hypothetical protein n=1 Tax=Rhizobium fredii TaxID=380 RepID=UPI0035181410
MVSTDVWHIEHRQELLILYGKTSVRWAAIDLLLVQILRLDLGNSAAAHDLIFNTAGAGKNRIEVFNRAIGASRFEQEERRKILMVTRFVTDLISARNDIIHSPLVTRLSLEGRTITPRLEKVGKSGKPKPVSIGRIEAHLTAIGSVLSQLEELMLELELKYGPDFGEEETV